MTTATDGGSPRLAERLLIVPDAHFRVEALRFQVEMYELFHRTTLGRAGHMLGTPTVLLGTFTATLAIHPALGTAVAAGTGVGMLVSTLQIDRLVALLAAVATAAITGAAYALALACGPSAMWIGASLALAGCGVQTLSHLAEDIPPPHSGRAGFVRAGEWLRGLSVREALRSAVLTFGVFLWLEAWASLRILPLQLLHVAMRLGHRPDLRRALDERIATILRGDDPHWREADARA